MRLKHRIAYLERKVAMLESDTIADIVRLEMRADRLKARRHAPETATCHICGKRDFKDNLADVGWMVREELRLDDADAIGLLYTGEAHLNKHAHPECAGIVKSDDGKGWVRVKDCKCKGKK